METRRHRAAAEGPSQPSGDGGAAAAAIPDDAAGADAMASAVAGAANASVDASSSLLSSSSSRSVDIGGAAVLWRVPHVQQTETWDCGLACARMAIEATGGPAVAERDALAVAQRLTGIGQDSLWTIDVCCVLAHYGVRHCFCTTFTGASEE